MKQTAAGQIANGPLDPVALIELGRGSGHLANDLIERQRLRVEGEDFIENPRLVAEIQRGGRGSFIMARASRLVVHGS